MVTDDMKDKIKWERGFWKRHPKFKKSGIALLTYNLINRSEIEDLQYLSIAWIARTLDVSESYISRAFKSVFASTPSPQTLIIRQKMKLARQLLIKQPHLSIDEVAEKLGYCCGNYFIKVFKKNCKITPQKYRRSEIRKRKRIYHLKRLSRKLERAINRTIFEATNGKFENAVMVHGGLDDREMRFDFFF
jgi:AraC-like DNA-binding protein